MQSDSAAPAHIPVLLEESVQALAVQPGGRYIDCTLGAGGHASSIMEHCTPGGQLLGIDADPEAIRLATEKLASHRGSCLLVNDNFANLEAICIKYDFFPVHGIFFDLGLSSMQLENEMRGFSFSHDGPLDMRFNPRQKLTAADIINGYSKEEMANVIYRYGEETNSYRIANMIVQTRPLKTTCELAQIVERAVGGRHGKIHPATKTFQSLRIAVNHEMESLESALKQAIRLLGYRGRLVVISYHSLEDRIVKQLMHLESRDCICPPEVPACICQHKATLRLISRKVITPTQEEIERNPRSRSAKLRAAERVFGNSEEFFRTVENADSDSDSGDSGANGWRRPALLKKLRETFALYVTPIGEKGG